MPTESAHDLGNTLRTLNLTIAAAESLTSGMVQTHLGACSGSSAYFKGGITAYSIDSKVELLGVNGTHAAEVNCVSQEVVRQMAWGVRGLLNADIGIATTGYAEPDPLVGVGTPFAWIGLSYRGKHLERKIFVDGNREDVQEEVADEAMAILVEWLLTFATHEYTPAPKVALCG